MIQALAEPHRSGPSLCRVLGRSTWVLLAILGSAPVACTSRGHQEQQAVDEPLLAYLSLARSLHHQADLAEDQGHIEQSLAYLQQLIATARPGQSPEVHEVLADTHARLADVLSRLGRFDEAAASLDEGLRHAPEASYFRGHLFEVRGLSEERRAKDLAARGDAPAVAAAQERARQALATAISIQEQVIARGTRDTGPR